MLTIKIKTRGNKELGLKDIYNSATMNKHCMLQELLDDNKRECC